MAKNIDLSQYEEINRREAMLSIGAGEKVICRLVIGEKSDISEISTMSDLSHVVNVEQNRLCDKLKFYQKKDKN